MFVNNSWISYQKLRRTDRNGFQPGLLRIKCVVNLLGVYISRKRKSGVVFDNDILFRLNITTTN